MVSSVDNALAQYTCEQTPKFYLDLIKDLKTDKIGAFSIDTSIHTPNLDLDEILKNMEEINDKICELLLIPKIPVVQHLDYFLNKGKSFDDQKYERLFDISSRSAGSKDAKIGSKLLDYSVKDKLVGFFARDGNTKWDDAKIADFIHSIKESNQN